MSAEKIGPTRPISFAATRHKADGLCYDSALLCYPPSSPEDGCLPGSPPFREAGGKLLEVIEQPMTAIEIEDGGERTSSS